MLTTNNTLLPRYHAPVAAVEPQSIESRTKVLLSTGNDLLASEYIAKAAAEQQQLRDLNLKQEIEVKTRALVGTVAEVKLAGVDSTVPSSNPPKDIVVPVTAPVFEDLDVDALRAHAAEHGLEISSNLRAQASIAAAVRAAHFAKYPVAPSTEATI